MNPEPARVDHAQELVDTGLTAVIQFLGRPRPEATGVDREDQGVEGRRIVLIEGAVDKDVVGRRQIPPGKPSGFLVAGDLGRRRLCVPDGNRSGLGGGLQHIPTGRGASTEVGRCRSGGFGSCRHAPNVGRRTEDRKTDLAAAASREG